MFRTNLRLAAVPALALLAIVGAVAQPPGSEPAFVKAAASAPKSVVPGKTFQVTVTLTIDSPYHIQGNPPGTDYIATVVTLAPPPGLTVGKVVYPKPVKIKFSGEEIPVYTGKVTVTLPITTSPTTKQGTTHLPISVAYQGCNNSSCFPPTKVETSVDVTIGKAAPAIGTTN